MPKQDVSNNTLIMGYAQNMYNEAMIMLREMGNAKMKPHAYTLSSVLPIVAEYMDFGKGKEIRGYGIRRGFERNGFITSGLTNVCKLQNGGRFMKMLAAGSELGKKFMPLLLEMNLTRVMPV
ncbi:hypothetical protein E3N88_07976 [Mikania micrantha]|uniref:Pentatricopeptide repeat-containing protein n=1 Tax=Mikania micrantha TaxID=192012 RepID=A0A5N6PGX2_9ASTR|nr:hypothetical protein E3N88_07976 [Mikania micrantha]